MKIVPKFQYGGNTGIGRTTSDWYKYVHSLLMQHILDMLSKYGNNDAYGLWLNNMQHSHSQIYNAAGGKNEAWKDKAYSDESVKRYQNDYLGNSNNLDTLINREDYFNYNNLGIANAYNNNVFIAPGKRLSGDNPNLKYVADGLYSSVTDWRRLLGRQEDWDENSLEYKDWQKQLNERGWETYLDTSDGYYKLRRLNSSNLRRVEGIGLNPVSTNFDPSLITTPFLPTLTEENRLKIEKHKNPNSIDSTHEEYKSFDWSKFKENLANRLPGILGAGRLAFTLWNNNRIYNEALKGIRPNLLQSYNTYRQVVGDEATKQAYYRRAAQGQTKASRPFTSDADKQMAYQFEAKRVGDELRALGDIADNQEIRRTSDESNQHAWDNIRRATEVGNTNTAAINQANALKHNLIAQKYSANGTSFDNYIKGIESQINQRLAERRSIQDQINVLQALNSIAEDPDLTAAKKAWDDAYKANDQQGMLDASKRIRLRQNALSIRLLLSRGRPLFGEKGIKISYKHKDDLLYKSARDAVDHFRKMSKISSDAYNRRTPKILKLASHPKGNTRKYLLGGIAPFMVYTPTTMGGETTMGSSVGVTGSSTSSKSSSSSDKGKETLDLIKTLFLNISEKGLPSDVNMLYQSLNGVMARAKAFGEDISTEDLASMYLQQMNNLSTIQYFKKRFDNIEQTLKSNQGEGEIAVTADGAYVVQDPKTAKITTTKNLNFAEQGVIPVTNAELLNIRALSGKHAFDEKLLEAASNGIGILKVATYIKSILPTLKSTASKTDSFVSKQIAKGISALEQAPSGDYKRTITDKSSVEQADHALNFIYSSLPDNMKAVIKFHANRDGLDVKGYVASLIAAGTEIDHTEEYSGSGSGSKKGNSNGLDTDMSPEVAFFMGMGNRENFVISDKTSDGIVIKTNSMPITNSEHHNLANATLETVSGGPYGGLYDQLNITMGGVKISTTGLNNVLITGGRIYSAELPVDRKALYELGIVKPDLKFLPNVELAEEEIRRKGITNRDNLTNDQIKIINLIYSNHSLPIVYTSTSDGPQLTSEYRRFAIMHAQATENAFEGDMTFNNSVEEITDDRAREQFEETMKVVRKDDKYSISNGANALGIHLWGGDDIYKGTLFIPMNNSTISALSGTGYKANPSEYMTIDSAQQERNEAMKLGYKPAGSASKLK